MRNVGLQGKATRRAAQIRALPGAVQNREARLIVRCARHAVVCRVFQTVDGLLFIPAGKRHRKVSDSSGWVGDGPYWLETETVEQLRVQCRCCADPHEFTTEQMLDHVIRKVRVMQLPML